MTEQTERKPEAGAVIKHPRAQMEMGNRGFEFNLDGAIRFAEGLIQSGMVPKGITHPGAVVGLIEAGKELGLQPMYALANLTFTNGRLGIMGDAAKALIRSKGALKPGTDFEDVYEGEENTPEWKCTVSAHRDGQPAPFAYSFSLADAMKAGLARIEKGVCVSTKGPQAPWSTYPKRMLMYRALGFLARDRFSDVLGGAVLTEELRDYPQEPHASIAPPAEPDPLLATAVASSPTEAVEAEIVQHESNTAVSEARDTLAPQAPSDPQQERGGDRLNIPTDEQKLTAAVEKLEGKIVSAESVRDIEAAWRDGAPLLKQLSQKERARLERLREQNLKNFEK